MLQYTIYMSLIDTIDTAKAYLKVAAVAGVPVAIIHKALKHLSLEELLQEPTRKQVGSAP